jgi:hypothetical protein
MFLALEQRELQWSNCSYRAKQDKHDPRISCPNTCKSRNQKCDNQRAFSQGYMRFESICKCGQISKTVCSKCTVTAHTNVDVRRG